MPTIETYNEGPACIELKGQKYCADGAHFDGQRIAAYVGARHPKGGFRLTNWKGDTIGRCWITSTWRTPRSSVSSRMHQIEANVSGVVYTGRGCGEGMLYLGKRKAKQQQS